MKVAISVQDNNGMESKIYGHFGSSPYYAIYDDETSKLEFIINDHHHGAHGGCHSAVLVAGKGIKAIISGGMGHNAFSRFSKMGVKVYVADETLLLKDIIEKFKQNQLKELTLEVVCSGRHGHHDHGHHFHN
ncbi:MAG TPA: NifB/NifX family molybdenum-iron cluster-binding protein [Spirochaetota bacterium]|nr:NifB/NifX family molybdenum-iron cluster-binding protein [Spirochaetota bacterium]HOM39054.1 NifB/NifX family molybdenum-iron cluster-binding protein [Spirochaetota bacterium]HPQ49960.1 NifB/NifX family molybdenum-iron cluster-binding protein [Spirochaetota bacterium]